jgi:hypothetical protein
MRYRKNLLAVHLPPPPQPWSDLAQGFKRIDASLASEPVPARWLQALRAAGSLRWASVAAALLVAAGLVYQHFRETPSVQAAALLQRAVAVAETRPARPYRLQVRTRDGSFMRTVNGRQTAVAGAAAVALAAGFQAAHYDWNDPLSARAYRDWRNGVPRKTDEVAALGERYRIRTVADEGFLASATLTLRATDLHPVEGRFEFRNRDWVELTELSEASTSEENTSAANDLEAPPRRVVPSQPAASSSGSSASISEELQVLAALHEIGADLGDPVEITRSGGRVLVSGVGVPSRRRNEIQKALEGIPGVAVEFAEPGAASVPQDGAAPRPAQEAPLAPLQLQMQQHLGGRANFERFGSQMLDWSDAAMARVYALRSLAQRYPAEVEKTMSGPDRAVLADLARAHAAALATRVNDLQVALAPVLTSLGGEPARGRPAINGEAWQAMAERMFRSARRVELLLSTLVSASQAAATAERVPSDLLAALADLRAQADQCQRMVE